MKAAVSLPDELFHEAEQMAKRLRVSRSHLYAQAIGDFLAASRADTTTAKLNDIYSQTRAEVDPELQRVQTKLLEESSW